MDWNDRDNSDCTIVTPTLDNLLDDISNKIIRKICILKRKIDDDVLNKDVNSLMEHTVELKQLEPMLEQIETKTIEILDIKNIIDD